MTKYKTGFAETINKIIQQNYHVFLAFDVADGNMTIKEYFGYLKKGCNSSCKPSR